MNFLFDTSIDVNRRQFMCWQWEAVSEIWQDLLEMH